MLVADVAAPVPDDATAHHLRRVLRLRDGEVVTVTDGAGRWRPCRLSGDRARGLTASRPRSIRRPRPVTIAVAPPKGERLEWLVQKCTEVGVDQLVLLVAERSVVRWDADRAARQLERLRRIAAEAAMQTPPGVAAERHRVPCRRRRCCRRAVAAEPGGRPLGPADTIVAIGPEGGWSPAELAAAADRVSLGDTVLRVETAAVVAATLLRATRTALR